MAELSNPTGIGQDGYLMVQKESAYGTPVTGSETFLPVKPGTLFKGYPEPIENSNVIASRLKQAPNQGRRMRTGTITMDMWPTLMGLVTELHLGASSNADNGDGSYIHYWLHPITGNNAGASWTVHQCVGASVGDQFDGVKSNNMIIRSDSSGNAEVELECVGQGLTEDIARETSFSYPSNATSPPMYFGDAYITLTDSGGSDTILLCANSIEIQLPMNYDTERFKICSSASNEIKDGVLFWRLRGARVYVILEIAAHLFKFDLQTGNDFVSRAEFSKGTYLLTVPSELLQPFCADSVADPFYGIRLSLE